MAFDTSRTIRDFTLEIPGATQIFEKLGIDYCCGGGRQLRDACLTAGVAAEEVALLLDQAKAAGEGTVQQNWQEEPLTHLTAYIISKHHTFTREELARLSRLFAKVCSVHGQNHPRLFELERLFQNLEQELIWHMYKEEQILFPYIEQLEDTVGRNEPPPTPCFGTVQNPVRMMTQEHENAAQLLQEMRQVRSSYTVPADGCTSFRTLYQALEAFEQDLHQHIHLENNILFPPALELERAGLAGTRTD